MPHLMIGYDFPLFLAHDAVFFLFAHQDLLHRVKQVLLGHIFPAVLHCIDGRFIYHIRQVCPHRPAGGKGNGIQVHAFVQMDVLGVHLKDFHPAL